MVNSDARGRVDPRTVAAPTRASGGCWGAFAAGALLLALAGLVGLYLALHPGPDGFDRWGYSFVTMQYHSPPLVAIADVGKPIVVAVVALVSAVVVARRDPRRAIGCLAGPFLAGVLAEYVLKPLVDPRAGGILTFPSGHTDGIAALVVVLALVLPRRARWVVVTLGSVLEVAACYAVVALGWHSPTDAAAGIAVGCGAVLAVDGLLHTTRRHLRMVPRQT